MDDVILGVGGRPFNDDARNSIAKAIQEDKEAIKMIESATTQPELPSVSSTRSGKIR